MATSSVGKVIKITLPPLHEGKDGTGGQVAIANHPARFKVIKCGRRWGKTMYGVWKCVRAGLEGKRVWWVAPTYKIANEGWVELKKLAYQMIEAGLEVEIRESDKQLVFPNGGLVEVRTSDVEGSCRGAGLDGVVIDEAASHRENLWIEELRPALIDKRGWADFIGTPKGLNWFTKLYARAESGAFANWASWSKTTWDNPYINEEERAEIELEYAGRLDKYRQEILAEIGASQYLVYEFNRDVHCWGIKELPEFIAYYGGIDFGGNSIGSHKSAGVVAGLTKNEELIVIDEFEEAGPNVTENQINWIGSVEANLTMKHRRDRLSQVPVFWAGDRSQMKFLDILRTYGYRIIPSKGGAGSVQAGIDLVATRLALRNGKPRLYYLPHLTKFPEHMETYHYYEPKEGDVPQRDNPVKVNDDLDDAIRYLVERLDGHVMGDPMVNYAGGILRAVR